MNKPWKLVPVSKLTDIHGTVWVTVNDHVMRCCGILGVDKNDVFLTDGLLLFLFHVSGLCALYLKSCFLVLLSRAEAWDA